MRTVLLEDDVYEHIAQHTAEIGESASAILRRLLGVSHRPSPLAQEASPAHELEELLCQPMFQTATTAVARMLKILRFVHDQTKGEFGKVLKIRGRERAYFARTKKEILESGESTQPREIPGTGYWVMTNSPTRQKQQLLTDVLTVLGYSEAAIVAAVRVIQ